MKYIPKNKKALSEMVGYVILIVIAVSLAAIVYPYLKQFILPDREECPSDVFIAIENINCNCSANSKMLSLTLSNRGYFTIPLVYTRMGLSNKSALASFPVSRTPTFSPEGNNYKLSYTLINYPNIVNCSAIPVSGTSFTVRVQPGILSKNNKIITCPSSVTETVLCKRD